MISEVNKFMIAKLTLIGIQYHLKFPWVTVDGSPDIRLTTTPDLGVVMDVYILTWVMVVHSNTSLPPFPLSKQSPDPLLLPAFANWNTSARSLKWRAQTVETHSLFCMVRPTVARPEITRSVLTAIHVNVVFGKSYFPSLPRQRALVFCPVALFESQVNLNIDSVKLTLSRLMSLKETRCFYLTSRANDANDHLVIKFSAFYSPELEMITWTTFRFIKYIEDSSVGIDWTC